MLAEGGPTDSETLTHIFHLHGINMRYLGKVLDTFKIKCKEKEQDYCILTLNEKTIL